jgi:hypothetical protein
MDVHRSQIHWLVRPDPAEFCCDLRSPTRTWTPNGVTESANEGGLAALRAHGPQPGVGSALRAISFVNLVLNRRFPKRYRPLERALRVRRNEAGQDPWSARSATDPWNALCAFDGTPSGSEGVRVQVSRAKRGQVSFVG